MTANRTVHKLYNIDLKSVDEQNRRITFCFSDNQPDREGEIVDQGTWNVDNYTANPIILWGHNPSENENVLGQGVNLELNRDGKSFITAQFDDADTNPKADMVFRQLVKRTLRTVSAGFISHSQDYDGDNVVLKDNELLEVSVVAIPANPRAIARSLKDGSLSRKDATWLMESMRKEADFLKDELDKQKENEAAESSERNPMNDANQKQIEALLGAVTALAESQNKTFAKMDAFIATAETKGTAASKSLPLAPEDTEWDSGEAIKRVKAWASDDDGNIDFTKYAKAFFWFDSSAPDPDEDGLPDRQGNYKLPFADVIDDKLQAVWHGVAAAYGALEGAQGGVDIPESDKDDVLAAIKGYYKKFDKTISTDKSFAGRLFNKGAVADELAEDAAQQAKWEQMEDVYDIFYAFTDVYYSDDTDVDSFASLLGEMISLLQKVAAGTYEPAGGDDDDDTQTVTVTMGKALATEYFQKALSTKDASTEAADGPKDDNATTAEDETTDTDSTSDDDKTDETADDKNDETDTAKDGDTDQSGAVTDEIDLEAEVTPELQAQIDAALEQTLTSTAA